MGRLKSVAVFEHAANCSGTEEADPMPCCEDVSQELKIEEITQVNFDFDSQPELYELAAIYFTLNNFFLDQQETTAYTDHLPPPSQVDHIVDHQVFLI